jgi:hypothetical protein
MNDVSSALNFAAATEQTGSKDSAPAFLEHGRPRQQIKRQAEILLW